MKTTKTQAEPDCRTSPTGNHEGYWINKQRGNFRCYHCGTQYHLRDLPEGVAKRCDIEVWRGS